MVAQLERANAFFNDPFFAGALGGVAITVERFGGNLCGHPGQPACAEPGVIALSIVRLGVKPDP